MSGTHFPNGVSAQTKANTNTSAGAGDLDCANLYASGSLIGQVVNIPITFSSASTAQVLAAAIPFAGNIISTYVTVGSTSAVAAAYTVQVGSAGSVAVASVSNTITTSYAQESLTTTTTAVTTASGLKVTRGVQGTAGDTSLTIVLKRTA